MAAKLDTLLALDVGEKRVGVARADSGTKLAFPVGTLDVDGDEIDRIAAVVRDIQPSIIVVGYPRNQAGEPTAQTAFVETFAQRLDRFHVPIVFQDESLTSVIAEQRLKSYKKAYPKSAIDAEAAAIILQDYIEVTYGY